MFQRYGQAYDKIQEEKDVKKRKKEWTRPENDLFPEPKAQDMKSPHYDGKE
jgi:hypothetical protein